MVVFALNIFWALAIIRMVKKVLTGGGMPAETTDPNIIKDKDDEYVTARAINSSPKFGKPKD